ncbi:transposase family protein [Pseudocalidococcus azoricus]|uniref:transposase family protein n=1 Tax=Pseudocalidococcus azoricus TaxID=3110322 RepID=UPI00389A7F65
MTPVTESGSILQEHFQSLEDPRALNLLEHQLLEIIGLTICAVICGAKTSSPLMARPWVTPRTGAGKKEPY